MTLSDILDGAFNLFKANARSVILIAAAFLVPVQMVSAFLRRDFLGVEGLYNIFTDPSTAQDAVDAGNSGNELWGILLAAGATVLVLPFVAGAISRVVAASYLGEDLAPGDAIRAVGRRWWALVIAWLLVHIVEGFGFLLCVLPGLMAMSLFVAVAPVIAVEGKGPIAGMRRSARLIRPRLFPVLGIAVLSGMLSSAVGGAIGFLPQVMGYSIGLKWGWILLGAGEILAGIVTTPLVAIVATLVYFDGRIRNEGLDLQIMAADLAGSETRTAR